MKRIDTEEMLAGLSRIAGKRRQWGNLRYKLTDILFIILHAIMCGMEVIEGRQEWLRKSIEMKNGAPSYATYERVLRMLEPSEIEKFYRSWAKAVHSKEGTSPVSIDAMGCQKKIAAAIREKNADYPLAVKGNQPTLNEGICEYMSTIEAGQEPEAIVDHWDRGHEKNHGRIERRHVTGLCLP